MSEITEATVERMADRVRAWCYWQGEHMPPCPADRPDPNCAPCEAAALLRFLWAEIERLRVWASDSHVTELEARLAEVERERDEARNWAARWRVSWEMEANHSGPLPTYYRFPWEAQP